MNRAFIIATLTRLGACDDSPDDALPWVRSLPEDITPERAWAACERGDWLVWLLGDLHEKGLLTRDVLVLAACAAARTALPHLVGNVAHATALAAIETAERWAHGKATRKEVQDASAAAYASASAYAAAYAASSAYASASAYAASASASAASASAYASAAAYASASAASAAYERARRRAETADAVRAVVPWQTVAAALGGLSAPGTA